MAGLQAHQLPARRTSPEVGAGQGCVGLCQPSGGMPGDGRRDEAGIAEVPPQPSQNRYVLVTRTIGEDDREVNAVMVAQREGSRVSTLSPALIHRLVNDGLRAGWGAPPVSDVDARPDAIVEDLERAQQWEELPVLFLQAIPSNTARLTNFYESDGVRGALTRHQPIRAGKAGFNLRIIGNVEIRDGALEYLSDFRRAIRIEPSACSP